MPLSIQEAKAIHEAVQASHSSRPTLRGGHVNLIYDEGRSLFYGLPLSGKLPLKQSSNVPLVLLAS